MNVILVHPIHGAKVAINELEMEQDIKNGWMEYNPDTPAEAVPELVIEAPKRKHNHLRKVTERPNEVPSLMTSANDESEGK